MYITGTLHRWSRDLVPSDVTYESGYHMGRTGIRAEGISGVSVRIEVGRGGIPRGIPGILWSRWGGLDWNQAGYKLWLKAAECCGGARWIACGNALATRTARDFVTLWHYGSLWLTMWVKIISKYLMIHGSLDHSNLFDLWELL
ncbi:hypothetical protein BJV78DRAFT_1158255 [Lactifluus subvellereus]|nr:hypothetical protein BJV78DRAFT_1158255 [Lactifluus subvellereus]